ncbi:MAG: methyltransferase domain-containing protein [Anaerolineae bacterium]
MTITHHALRITHHVPVSSALYSEDLLLTFSGDEYADFLAGGGRQLRPRLARALELANLAPGMHVVDIGCGRGEITLHAARRGAVVTAVDFSEDCLDITSRTLKLGPPAARARVRLARADGAALPLADKSAHRVFCLDVVEHLQPWQFRLALAEIRRVLRPDGYAVIHTLPNRWALDIGYPLMRCLWPGLPAEPRSAYEQQVHVNELDPIRLSRAIGEAGLQSRVWLENWTVAHARWGDGRRFPDRLREGSYPLLRRQWVRPVVATLMRTPLRLIFANDLFAIAWPQGCPAPAPWSC